MKRIVYALIATNLVFFMALMWIDTDPAIPVLPEIRGVDKLVLVSEQIPEKVVSASRPEKKNIPSKPGNVKRPLASADQCYLMSYFTNNQDAETAISGMQALEYKTRLDVIYPETGRLLVYLPPFPDIDQAREVTRALKEKGIRDFQILAIKGNKNAISLGVFSHADTAKERVKEISKLGFKPAVQSVVGAPLKYQIYFYKTKKAGLNNDERHFLVNSFKKVKITTTKCES